jgi:hypothetical protein
MLIEGYRFGVLVIAGESYTEDVMVFPDRVVPNWRRKEGHVLGLEDLKAALEAKPEVLIVGTGTQELLAVSQAVVAHTQKEGIELLAFDTRTACRTFNELVASRRVVAALHLTC